MAAEEEYQPLSRLHIMLNRDWLSTCRKYLKSVGAEAGEAEIFEQFLFSDMKTSCRGAPCKIPAKATKIVLQRPFVLQVVSVLNIAQPAYDQYCELTATVDDLSWFHGEDDESEPSVVPQRHLPSHQRRRTLKIELTDGVSNFDCLEFGVLTCLDENTVPGTKVLLKPRLLSRVGCIFLNDENCQVLGGEIEGDFERRRFLADLLEIKPKTPKKTSAPPPPQKPHIPSREVPIPDMTAATVPTSFLPAPVIPTTAPKQVVAPLPSGVAKTKAPRSSTGAKPTSSRLNSSLLNSSAQSTLSPFLVRMNREKSTTDQQNDDLFSISGLKREPSVSLCSPNGTLLEDDVTMCLNASASTENLLSPRVPANLYPSGKMRGAPAVNSNKEKKKQPEPLVSAKKNILPGPFKPKKSTSMETSPRKYRSISDYYSSTRRRSMNGRVEEAMKRRFDESNDGDLETTINNTMDRDGNFNWTAASDHTLSTSFTVPELKLVRVISKPLFNEVLDDNNNINRQTAAQNTKKPREEERQKQKTIQKKGMSDDSIEHSLFEEPLRRQANQKPPNQKRGETSSRQNEQKMAQRQNHLPRLDNDGVDDMVVGELSRNRDSLQNAQNTNKIPNPIAQYAFSRQDLHWMYSHQKQPEPFMIEDSLFGESSPREESFQKTSPVGVSSSEQSLRQKQQSIRPPPWLDNNDNLLKGSHRKDTLPQKVNKGPIRLNDAVSQRKQPIERPPWEDREDLCEGPRTCESVENSTKEPVSIVEEAFTRRNQRDPRQIQPQKGEDSCEDSLFGSPRRREQVSKQKGRESLGQKRQLMAQRQIEAPSIPYSNSVEIGGNGSKKGASEKKMGGNEESTDTQPAPLHPPWETEDDEPIVIHNRNATQFDFSDLICPAEARPIPVPVSHRRSVEGLGFERFSRRSADESQASPILDSPACILPWGNSPVAALPGPSTPPLTMRFTGPPVLLQRKESSSSSIMTPPVQQRKSTVSSAANSVAPVGLYHNLPVEASILGNTRRLPALTGVAASVEPIEKEMTPPGQHKRPSASSALNNAMAGEAPIPRSGCGLVPIGCGGVDVYSNQEGVVRPSSSSSDRYREFYSTLSKFEITTLAKVMSEYVFWMMPQVKCIQGICTVPDGISAEKDRWILKVFVSDTSYRDLKCEVDSVLLEKMLGFSPSWAKEVMGRRNSAELNQCKFKAKAVSHALKRLDLLLFILFAPERSSLPQIVSMKSFTEIMQNTK